MHKWVPEERSDWEHRSTEWGKNEWASIESGTGEKMIPTVKAALTFNSASGPEFTLALEEVDGGASLRGLQVLTSDDVPPPPFTHCTSYISVNSLPSHNTCEDLTAFVFSNSHQILLVCLLAQCLEFWEDCCTRIRDWGLGAQGE